MPLCDLQPEIRQSIPPEAFSDLLVDFGERIFGNRVGQKRLIDRLDPVDVERCMRLVFATVEPRRTVDLAAVKIEPAVVAESEAIRPAELGIIHVRLHFFALRLNHPNRAASKISRVNVVFSVDRN